MPFPVQRPMFAHPLKEANKIQNDVRCRRKFLLRQWSVSLGACDSLLPNYFYRLLLFFKNVIWLIGRVDVLPILFGYSYIQIRILKLKA